MSEDNSLDPGLTFPPNPGSDDCLRAGAAKRALPPGLVSLRDGVYFDLGLPRPCLLAAVNKVFLSNVYFLGIDYAVFIKALYDVGPPLAPGGEGGQLVRFATAPLRFDAQRRVLYQPVHIDDGEAGYFFEDVVQRGRDSDGAARRARLDFDEFVAEMWRQGLRFGIDAPTVEAALTLGKVGSVVVARRLEMVPGRDALIINLQDMNRSYVPRQLANGRLDLLSFKSHSPHVRKNVRLLKKTPGTAGFAGYELSGEALPPPCHDIMLSTLAGPGTVVEQRRDGEFLLSTHEGFMNVDPATGLVSIDTKIISHDGVSNRTTGNLRLNVEYEEFGEVQEMRLVEGGDITIHGDVFGNINSRGGKVLLHSNMIGGSVQNAHGDIEIKGVASGAVLQTKSGTVYVQRAESCIISGTKVMIGQASNCEIIADEVSVLVAEGCAIGGRRIEIDSAGPRKQIDMLVFALVPDMGGFNQKVAEIEVRAEELRTAAVKCQQEIDRINSQADVRKFLLITEKLRKKELALTPEQVPQFQQLAAAVRPGLNAVSRLWLDIQQMDAQKTMMLDQADEIVRQKRAAAGQSRCTLHSISGETLVRSMTFDARATRVYDKGPKEIKATLRGAKSGIAPIFAGSSGTLDWTFDS